MEAIGAQQQGRELLRTSVAKKRTIGLVLFAVILGLFFSFNRFPKLDIVDADLDAVSGAEVQCFQGFCLERDPASGFLSRWWGFSVTYLRLVTMGMTFAFLIAGLAEAFLFPQGTGHMLRSGGALGRTVKGLAVGPVMNLCSACIVPVSAAYQRRGGGIEGAIAMVQGSATMNVPSLAMVFLVFTPLMGFSRLILAITGALLIGPIVAMSVARAGGRSDGPPEGTEIPVPQDVSSWAEALSEGSRDWRRPVLDTWYAWGPSWSSRVSPAAWQSSG